MVVLSGKREIEVRGGFNIFSVADGVGLVSGLSYMIFFYCLGCLFFVFWGRLEKVALGGDTGGGGFFFRFFG